MSRGGISCSGVVCLSAGILAVTGACSAVRAQDASAPRDPLLDALTASVSITEQYNDNIFYIRNPPIPVTGRTKSDFITIITPAMALNIDRQNLDFTLGGTAEIGRYARNPSEDYEDFRIYADAALRLAPDLLVFGGASFLRDHEERGSPDDVNGAEPTIYTSSRLVGAALKRFGKTNVKIGATFDYLDFDDVPAGPGAPVNPINNDDRDRGQLEAGIRVGHNLTPENEIFGEVTYDRRDYRQGADDFGFDRDSDGVRVAGGLRRRVGNTLDADAFIGWIHQDYDDPALSNVSTLDMGGRVVWRPVTDTTLRATLGRSVVETTLPGSSSYVQTGGNVGVVRWVRPDTRLDASLGYYANDYQGAERTDHLIYASLGARYYVSPHVFVGLDYEYENRDSNDIDQNYEQSRVMARLGANLNPGYNEEALSGETVAPFGDLDFYLGVQTGLLAIGTDLAGPRAGGAGTLQADFADLGYGGGVFGGFGLDIGLWRVGLEGDVSFADADWDHSRLPGGRVFSVDRKEAYGVSALLGRTLPGGTLFYGRAGVAFARFETDYATQNNSVDRDETELGFRFGIGGAVPLGARLAFRMEYGYGVFDDYNISPSPGGGAGTDNFRNWESGVQVGLAYNFLPMPEAHKATFTPDFDGFYAGLQIGHGALTSATTGPRDAGSTLAADFGDAGVTGGVFVGYSVRFGGFVLGVEGEVEISDAAWDHDREVGGSARDFQVDKQYSIGAGLRAGYVVSDTALLYARAGLVRSGLKTTFDQLGATVRSTDHETALRYGFGIELPVTEKTAVRLDYTHTDYGTSSITAPDGGVDRYDTSESLFRLGTVFSF